MADEEQIILPDGFKRVEYLESSGTQWIDTGIIPNNETGAYVKALQTVNGNTFPIGAGSNNSGWVPMRLLMKGNTSYPTYRWGTTWADSSSSFNDNIIYTSEFNWLNVKSVNLFRGEELIISKTLNSSTNINPGCTAAIFAVNNNTGSINYQWKGRVYEVKISQGTEIVKHFVPTYDTYTARGCMYEVIEGKAYYNKGAGELLCGFGLEDTQLGILHKLPEGFTKVNYLLASGSQYIDTNYVPTNETGYYVECQTYQTNTSWLPVFGLYEPNVTDNRIYFYTNPYPCMGWMTAKQLTSSLLYRYENLKCEYNFLNSRKIDIKVGTNLLTEQLQPLNFTPTVPIYLFAAYGGSGSMYGRINTFLISEGDQIVRHFVPCLDTDGIPCMYELYTGTAHYNQGPGQFSYPREYINGPINLPAGYTKCIYLQSNGTQWIDTEFIANEDTGLYLKVLHLSNGDHIPFGSGESGKLYYPPRINTSSKEMQYSYGSSYMWAFYYDKGDDLIYTSTMNLYNDKTVTFISEDTKWSAILTNAAKATDYSLWLFSCNKNTGSIDQTHGKFSGRIFRAKITQCDYLIHDFVPCLDENNRPCMYDLITQIPYYNQSGGEEFDYCVEHQIPSDFIKLKYLEDTGTQYINIGIIPTNETGLYVDAQQITHTNTHVMGSGHESNNTGFSAPRFLKGASNTCGFLWKTWNSFGNIGNGTRFEGYLNFFNNRKANLKTAGTTERINNLGELGFTPTASLHMFRTNYSSQGSWNGRIYRAKITQDTELIRDFVPAWDERKLKPCMYDLINNVAYYNDGEGEFLYNRDVEGTYKGYTGLGCIGNRLGTFEFEWKIPYGYRRVAYLESNGNQWIDTGIIVNSPNIDIKITFLNNDISKYRLLQAGTNFTYVLNWTSLPISDTQVSMGNISVPQVNVKHTARFRKNEFILNDVKQNISSSDGYNNFASDFAYTAKLFSFVYPTADTNYKSQWFSGKVYSCELALDGILLRNFIPCLDPNNKPCMFDIITQQPFYNQGNGEDFTYGII